MDGTYLCGGNGPTAARAGKGMPVETVFHYGRESEKFLRDFECRRAEYAIGDLVGMPPGDLKVLLSLFRQDNRTFAGPAAEAV